MEKNDTFFNFSQYNNFKTEGSSSLNFASLFSNCNEENSKDYNTAEIPHNPYHENFQNEVSQNLGKKTEMKEKKEEQKNDCFNAFDDDEENEEISATLTGTQNDVQQNDNLILSNDFYEQVELCGESKKE